MGRPLASGNLGLPMSSPLLNAPSPATGQVFEFGSTVHGSSWLILLGEENSQVPKGSWPKDGNMPITNSRIRNTLPIYMVSSASQNSEAAEAYKWKALLSKNRAMATQQFCENASLTIRPRQRHVKTSFPISPRIPFGDRPIFTRTRSTCFSFCCPLALRPDA